MSPVSLEIIIIFLLILANGLFAMSEIAIISARRLRLQQEAEAGSRGAQAALELTDAPSRFLSTVQIGITLVGVFTGAFGGATLARELSAFFARFEWLAPYSEAAGVGVVVIAITYFTLVIGELAPKRIALSQAERIATLVAPMMRMLARITAPAVRLLSFSTDMVVRLLGISPEAAQNVTEEEVKLMIEQGTQVGVFEPIEEEMVEKVFRLSDRTVSALITPRTEILWLDANDDPDAIIQQIISSHHSRFPVAQGSLDNLLGVVLAKDLLAQALAGEEIDLRTVLQPGLFVPEGMPALKVLDRFREARSQLALVIDEYGVLQGLVTINNILEAIVGDLPEGEEQPDPEIVRRKDGTFLLDGMLPLDTFKQLFQLSSLPYEDIQAHQTLGGFVMASLGRIPSTGDTFEWQGLDFEVVDMDGYRVDKVLVEMKGADTTAVSDADLLADADLDVNIVDKTEEVDRGDT
jgi:putative hemolysin